MRTGGQAQRSISVVDVLVKSSSARCRQPGEINEEGAREWREKGGRGIGGLAGLEETVTGGYDDADLFGRASRERHFVEKGVPSEPHDPCPTSRFFRHGWRIKLAPANADA